MTRPSLNSPPRPRWRDRIRHFILGPNPLHPAVWEGRLSPITFRRFELADLAQCLEIYKLNEPGRFPEGVMANYEKCLREQNSYFLVAERDGKIVATGGMAYWLKPHLVNFCFGLVRPEHHGKGLGAALTLARLALLNQSQPVYCVYIKAVEKSFGYYQRFGFQPNTPWLDMHGEEHPTGCLVITYDDAVKCRQLLDAHGISVPRDEDKIPMRAQEDAVRV